MQEILVELAKNIQIKKVHDNVNAWMREFYFLFIFLLRTQYKVLIKFEVPAANDQINQLGDLVALLNLPLVCFV